MKTEIFEECYADLNLTNSCVTFNSTNKIQNILVDYCHCICGICILTLNTGEANVYKFSFSSIGDDGNITVVSKNFELDNKVVKSIIVNYAIEKIGKMKS